MNFDYNELMLFGFYKTSYDGIDSIPINDVIFDRENDGVSYPSILPNSYEDAIDITKNEIVNVLNQTFSSVESESENYRTTYFVWDGVDSKSLTWHTDNNEGGSVFALLYFDTMAHDGSDGGAVHFRSLLGDIIIYPTHGDLIFLSNNTAFQHRADRSPKSRRLANFTFDCKL